MQKSFDPILNFTNVFKCSLFMLSQVMMVPVRAISKGLAAETAIRHLPTVSLGFVGCICVVCDTLYTYY